MSPEHDPSNATLLAKLDGLDTFMRLSVKNLDEKFETVSTLPVKVAALEKDVQAVTEDVAELKDERKRDREGFRNRFVQWASAAFVAAGVAVSIILSITGGPHG